MALPRPPILAYIWALLLMLALPAITWAHVGQPLHISDEDGTIPLGRHLDVLVDPTGVLKIEDVVSPAHAGDFKPSKDEIPTYGFTPDAIWVRFALRAETDEPEHYMVEMAMSRLSHFDWYVVADGKVVQRLAAGSADHKPGTHRTSRFPLLSVVLRRGESAIVYARAQSDTAIWLPLTASTPATQLESALRRDSIDFLTFGACLAMLLISVSLGIIFRRHIYFYASLMPPCYLLHQAIFGGHYLMLDIAWPEWVGRKGMLLVVSAFCATFTLFVREFFSTRSTATGHQRALRLSLVVLGMAVACVLILPFRTAAQTAQSLYILSFICVIWAAASQARREPTVENLLLIGGGLVPLLGTTLLLAQWMALMPTLIEPVQLMRAVLPATFVIFLLACARSQRSVQEIEAKLGEAHRAETEARLEALRHQLNPHFAYNALASIDALSREAPEKIPELVGRLGAFLRHRMAPSGQPLNELSNELEATRAYLDIEQGRLEGRLSVDYDLDPSALPCLIPEFCLQPLAENALKYGLSEASEVRIRISARIRDGHLVLAVSNTGRIDPERAGRRGASIGLGNLRRRLALHHGGNASVELHEADGWVTARIDIPAQARASR